MRRLCHFLDPSHPSPCRARTSRLCTLGAAVESSKADHHSRPRQRCRVLQSSTHNPTDHRQYIARIFSYLHITPKQATMAGEVTRKQQKLQIAAEDPPSFHRVGYPDNGWEKAKMEQEISKVCYNDPYARITADQPKETSFWTKARWKARRLQ